MESVSFTQGAMWFLGQALEGFGRVRAGPLGCERLGLGRGDRSAHARLGPNEVEDDDEPNECEENELIDNMMRHHGIAPSPMY